MWRCISHRTNYLTIMARARHSITRKKNPSENQPTADHTTYCTRRSVFFNLSLSPESDTSVLAEIPTQPNTASTSIRASHRFHSKPVICDSFHHTITQAHPSGCFTLDSPLCFGLHCLSPASERAHFLSSMHMTKLGHGEGRVQSPASC